MALAILRFLDSENGKNRFQVELGGNRFYRYAIGGYEVSRNHGLAQLQDPIYTSPLMGPLPESSLGRTILEVPTGRFDRQHRCIQITSFRTAQQIGPAISEIVTVLDVGSTGSSRDTQDLPAISFNLATEDNIAMDKPLETVPFQYREVSPISEEMALGGILNAVKNVARSVAGTVAKAAPTIMNTVAQVAPAVLGSAPGTPGAEGGVASIIGALLPQLAGTIGGVLPQLTGGTGETDPATGQPAIDPNQIATLLAGLLQQVSSTPTGQIGGSPAINPTTAIDPQAGSPAFTNPPPAPPLPVARPPASRTPRSPAPRRPMSQARSMALSNPGYASAYDFAALIDQEYPDVRSASVLDSYYAGASALSASDPAYLDAYSLAAMEDEYADVYGLSLASSDSETDSETDDSDYAGAMSAEYAESMFLPALGGLFASLAPKLLSFVPQLLSSFGPQLGGLFGSLFGGGQQAPARQMSLMMGLDEEEYAEEQAVVVALSLAMAASTTPDLVFRRIDTVKLAFSEVTPLTIQGKSRFLYRQDQDISFPLTLETPQPVKQARLQLLVKHPKTLKILLEQNYRIESATSGILSVTPKLSKEQLKKLSPNEEYLVCAALVWKGRSKKTGKVMKLGTNTMQLITLVGEYLFDRIEGAGQTVALNDVDRFRPYWHKIWQGDFMDDLRRIEFQCKYYYTLENNRSENARMETVTQVLQDDMAGRKSRMKSGLIVSPYGLNELLGQLGTHPRLSEAELSSLVGAEFKGRFHHAARTGVKFKGKPGQTVALWVYPEVKLQQVVLRKAENTNANGLVQTLKEHPVYFPMPSVAHFIGTST